MAILALLTVAGGKPGRFEKVGLGGQGELCHRGEKNNSNDQLAHSMRQILDWDKIGS